LNTYLVAKGRDYFDISSIKGRLKRLFGEEQKTEQLVDVTPIEGY